MIWLFILGLAAAALAPVALLAARARAARGRRDAALALHRAQLGELDRDLALGRLLPGEHAAAVLEVQRRLLADAALEDAAPSASRGRGVWLALALVPVAAVSLYLVGGDRRFWQGTQAATQAEIASRARDDALVAQLRNRLALMNPDDPRRMQGYTLLGNAELSRGHLPEAAQAWRAVLNQRFDPTTAVELAEVLTEMAGSVTPEAANLFRRALAEAPPDAAWRRMAEKRIRQEGQPIDMEQPR